MKKNKSWPNELKWNEICDEQWLKIVKEFLWDPFLEFSRRFPKGSTSNKLIHTIVCDMFKFIRSFRNETARATNTTNLIES